MYEDGDLRRLAEARIETAGGEVIWTTTNPIAGEDRAKVDAILDAFHELPDDAGSDFAGYLARLAERDVTSRRRRTASNCGARAADRVGVRASGRPRCPRPR